MTIEHRRDGVGRSLPNPVNGSGQVARLGARFSHGSYRFEHGFVGRALAAGCKHNSEVNYALSIVSGWCYAQLDTLQDRLDFYGLPFTVQHVAVTNDAMLIVASAYVLRSHCGQLAILAFRGTEPANLINWLTNADVTRRRFFTGQVHHGFYQNVEAVWDRIVPLLGDSVAPALKGVFITGHSLGGAMAVLAAARIFEAEPALKPLVHGIYTYGQPAVGDARFAAACDSEFGHMLYRHAYGADLVPRLPPSWQNTFIHFGRELVTARASEEWSAPETMQEQARSLLWAGVSVALSFFTRRLGRATRLGLHLLRYSLDDHSPTGYIQASRTSVIGSG